jgi:hypothetical protein
MNSGPTNADAINALSNLWYIIAERIFERVVTVTGLDEKRVKALREVAVRPALFEVAVEETPEPCPRTIRDARDDASV